MLVCSASTSKSGMGRCGRRRLSRLKVHAAWAHTGCATRVGGLILVGCVKARKLHVVVVATAALLAAGTALALAAETTGAPRQASGTLQLNAVFTVRPQSTVCPQGTPSTTSCFLDVAKGVVPGLGDVTETLTLLFEAADPNCAHVSFTSAAIAVAGKGAIKMALTDRYRCVPPVEAAGVIFDSRSPAARRNSKEPRGRARSRLTPRAGT